MLERKAVIRRLNELKQSRIIFVCAPAGCGKTVAVSQWLDKDIRAKAVLALDEYDNNIAGFCARFCTTLTACQPQNKTLGDIVSHTLFQSAPEEFTLRAVSALSVRKQTVLVLDDLHHIYDDNVLRLLDVLIKRLPKNFQIVIISRRSLPPRFSELKLKGVIARIGMESLLFDADDIKVLCSKRGNEISAEQADYIIQKTEGWAMGVDVFLLLGEKIFDPVGEYFDDFIETNIWDKWDDEIRNFMLHTAALRKLTPDICTTMTGISQSDKMLKALMQKGVFITQSQDGSFYRYHDLFQHFLLRMAKQKCDNFLETLLQKEGNWHLANKDFYNAIECFMRCDDDDGIARCFEFMADSGIINFSISRFLPIMNHPAIKQAAKKYPNLLYFTAYGSIAQGNAADAIYFMDEYYKRYPEFTKNHPRLTRSAIYMLLLDFRIPVMQVVERLEAYGENHIKNTTSPQLIFTMHMPLFHRGVIDYSIENKYDIVDYFENEFFSKTNWSYGDRSPLFIDLMITGILYERGELQKAHFYAIRSNSKINDNTLIDTKLCAMYILVSVLDAQGLTNEATEVMRTISDTIESTKSYHLNPNFNAFVTRRQLSQGNIKAAEHWIEQNHEPPTFWTMYIGLTTCKALIVAKKYDAAMILIQNVMTIITDFNRIQDLVYAKILMAIACNKMKRCFNEKALEYLENAVIIAEQYGYTQMFVNEAADLYPMLYKLLKSVEQRKGDGKKHRNFIKILCSETAKAQNSIEIYPKRKTEIKLTEKQKKILQMLQEGKVQREISEEMGIKQSTLRTHLTAIYQKLEAANAADAVRKTSEIEGIWSK